MKELSEDVIASSAESSSPTVDVESPSDAAQNATQKTVLGILVALSISHLLNDTMQSIIPAIYPVLKQSFQLNYTQIGWITLVNQMTASVLQPLVGWRTDKHPLPFSLPIGMG